ncbi:MAG: hypothetical protein Athens101428_695 [Candidatus Berkelbacteria bacterium Athens1014_28]|uniref:Uncharacterized protein n=1 Tax=Candidatus Berkelbacteria bacterium Athens1014_28 TaxID=2017145 RepID=A0A554LKC7_9BACT|nr:MAG: hypothetical protein Athens101428_695 [Candidatus Berkelbacteria bacterium Athens1014_28]
MSEEEQPNSFQHLPEEDFEIPDEQKVERRQALERKSDFRVVIIMIENGMTADEVIVKELEKKTKKSLEICAETLKFLKAGVEMMPEEKFPKERREEVLTSLAEVVLAGHLSSQALEMLTNQIKMISEVADTSHEHGYSGCAFYRRGDDERRGIFLTEELFEKNSDGTFKYDVNGIVKHEAGHGLVEHGELFDRQKVAEKIKGGDVELSAAETEAVKMIDLLTSESEWLPKVQSEIVISVLGSLKKLEEDNENDQFFKKYKEQNPEVSFDQYLTMRKIRASEEILADKVGIYLTCNGKFDDFLRVSLEKSHNEIFKMLDIDDNDEGKREYLKLANEGKTKEILENWPELSGYIDQQKIFFTEIQKKMTDKENPVEERIAASIERANAGAEDDFDDLFDFGFGDFGYAPPMAENQNRGAGAKNNELLSATVALFQAASKELELPITPIS